ncbi:hypothetical protein LUZ60_002661 [Juncus effusus]|nr:hypothetical protein LUZ60_002661 [Juncus effusus]
MAPTVNCEIVPGGAEEEIPTIDFNLLVNGSADQRSEMIQKLGTACEDWGFFMIVNHGVSESLREAMIMAFKDLFDLTADEKQAYVGGHVLDPIRVGTSFNAKADNDKYWRHYAKIFVHPDFHSPSKPLNFRDVSEEYTTSIRSLVLKLLKAIWESLGLEEARISNFLDLNSCFQILVGNLYPPCPNPENKFGMPPHSDHGLLTVLYQNGIDGLQVMHKEKWITVKPVPNSFLVNTGDHMEIVTNGKYKSLLHRALLTDTMTRMSIVTVVGPSLDKFVGPFSDLLSTESPAVFHGFKYRDYMEYQQSNTLAGKSALDLVRM